MGIASHKREKLLNKRLKKRILLVDDNPRTIDVEREILGTVSEYEIITASAWDDAVDKAIQEGPSIIIVNLFFSIERHNLYDYFENIKREIMGERPIHGDRKRDAKDGFNLSYYLKRNPETASIPILGVGPMDITYLKDMALKAGCDDYLSKPFGVTDLLEKVKTLLIERK